MSALEQYSPGGAVALPPAIPDAARGIVEWAQSADAAYSLAQRLVATSFCPQQFRNKPDEAAAAMLSGAEVGLSPMASLRAFDVIQGTAAPKALTQRAVAQSFGHELVLVESTPMRCVMRGKRRGTSDWQQVEWTIQRANQLGVTNKPNWKSQPQAMLLARATGEIARLVAADALLGIGYNAEELADEAAATTTVTRAASPAPTPARRVQRRQQAAPAPEEPSFDDSPADVAPAPQGAASAPAEGEQPSGARTYRGGITEGQMRLLQAAYRDRKLGGDEHRDARLNDASARLNAEVLSFSDLTTDEASRLIDSLQAPEVEEPPEPDWGEGA